MPDICLQTIMLMDIDETLRAWHKRRDSTIFGALVLALPTLRQS